MKKGTNYAKRRPVFHALSIGTAMLVVLFFCSIQTQAFPDDDNRKVDEILQELVPLISHCADRHDQDYAVFHGCVDWHSAVHALWALLRVANRNDSFAQYGEQALRILQYSGLERELEYLKNHPNFEMPYGRAWLLRLSIEYEKWCTDNNPDESLTMRELSNYVAASLMNFYRSRDPDITDVEYANDSWGLVQLYSYYLHAEGQVPFELKKLIDRTTTEPNNLRFAQDYTARGFFSAFGNWVYLIAISQSQVKFTAIMAQHLISDTELRPLTPVQSLAHRLGLNWSRAWALKSIYQRHYGGVAMRFKNHYWQHVESGLRTHRIYAGSYRSYAHWVPQFAVYALTDN